MRISMPDIFKIQVTGTCPSHARTELKARQHRVTVDEPRERGGEDTAPTPLETLFCSYLACTNVIANLLAHEMGVEIKDMSFELTAHFDTRGVFGKAEVAVPFPDIDLTVDITTEAGEDELERLQAALARRCPVSAVLRGAGCRINETWHVNRP